MIFPLRVSNVLGNDPSEIQWLKGRVEVLEKRLTWIERLLMTE
jgi:hypothetical protein